MIPRVSEGAIAATAGDANTSEPDDFARRLREVLVIEQPHLYNFLLRHSELLNDTSTNESDHDAQECENSKDQLEVDGETYEIVDAGALFEQGALITYWLIRTAFEAQALEIESEVADVIRAACERENRPWWQKIIGAK